MGRMPTGCALLIFATAIAVILGLAELARNLNLPGW